MAETNSAATRSMEGSPISEDNKLVEKYKSALEKMVRAYDAQKEKMNEKSNEIAELKKQNESLSAVVQKYIGDSDDKENGVSLENIKEIAAVTVIDSVNWVGIRTNQGLEWHREETLVNKIPELKEKFELPETLNINEIYQQRKDDEKNKLTYQEDLANVIKQYEGRFKKMQSHYEQNEKQIATLMENNKELTTQYESLKAQWYSHSVKILEDSSEIRESSLLYVNDEVDNVTKSETMNKMKALIFNLQKMGFEETFAVLNDIKDHILLLHETLFDALKRLSNCQEELNQQEKTWRKTCDALMAEKEKERQEKLEIIEAGRKKIKDLESTFDAYKMDTTKNIKERDLKIDFLTQESKKNANTQYIKNILMNFFTANDTKVQDKLVPVLGNVLQFSPEELEVFKSSYTSSFRSSLSKLFTNPFAATS